MGVSRKSKARACARLAQRRLNRLRDSQSNSRMGSANRAYKNLVSRARRLERDPSILAADESRERLKAIAQGRYRRHYMLEGPQHKVTYTHDVIRWAEWLETADRIVARTVLLDGSIVSTVFLGLDHNFGDDGEPILFESAVIFDEDTVPTEKFNGREYRQCDVERRYCTWGEAEIGHMEMCDKLNYQLSPDRLDYKK